MDRNASSGRSQGPFALPSLVIPDRSTLPRYKTSSGGTATEKSGRHLQAGRNRRSSSLALATFLGKFGLLAADEAVAVEVEFLEIFRGAQKLGARDVAVAVTVHLAEPQRAAR